MIDWRKTVAGGVVTAVCVLGLAVSAGADQKGRGKRPDPRGAVDLLAGPAYDGRKPGDHQKLDRKLNERSRNGGLGLNRSRAIVVLKPGCSVDSELARVGGRKGRRLSVISGQVVELPNGALRRLADNACVASIHWDRKIGREMNRASIALGAKSVRQELGFDGAGIGVAVIDSGITGYHDDLGYQGSNPNVQVVNGQRVTGFVDFVNGQSNKYDDNGHGSHVAGIIAGSGKATLGARAGIAPAADIVSLKVLDATGGGYISNVIAALDWVVTNGTAYNIRVVNLSVGAGITESYMTDPLTLAAKRVVDAGVVVVSAAGNLGTRDGHVQYGGILAPGNAPWVLTVGADSHMGTTTRTDDTMTTYSSRGPTWMDFNAKPDVVAPGTGIVSLSVPGSLLYVTHPTYLLSGSLLPGMKPYMSLTGTSMAAPMVTGTVALMMQANPNLTPNLAKAIIEYTAQDYGYNELTQGAGFLNTEGAVKLARYLYTAQAGSVYPSHPAWSRTILWGNRRVKSGVIKPAGNAYALNIVWGTARDGDGDNIVWGTHCPTAACDDVIWGTVPETDADNIAWGTVDRDGDNIVWGTDRDGDNIVWGTSCGGDDCFNIVWGTACGGDDCFNIVWGTDDDGFNIVWGTACAEESCDGDNIVWGTACAEESCDGDNIVWGTDTDGDNIVWGTTDFDAPPIYDDPDVPSIFDDVPFDSLFGTLVFPPAPTLPVVPSSGGSGTPPGGGSL